MGFEIYGRSWWSTFLDPHSQNNPYPLGLGSLFSYAFCRYECVNSFFSSLFLLFLFSVFLCSLTVAIPSLFVINTVLSGEYVPSSDSKLQVLRQNYLPKYCFLPSLFFHYADISIFLSMHFYHGCCFGPLIITSIFHLNGWSVINRFPPTIDKLGRSRTGDFRFDSLPFSAQRCPPLPSSPTFSLFFYQIFSQYCLRWKSPISYCPKCGGHGRCVCCQLFRLLLGFDSCC